METVKVGFCIEKHQVVLLILPPSGSVKTVYCISVRLVHPLADLLTNIKGELFSVRKQKLSFLLIEDKF